MSEQTIGRITQLSTDGRKLTMQEARAKALKVLAVTDKAIAAERQSEANRDRRIELGIADNVEIQAREIEQLRAEVREWLCDKCNTVYHGPPAEGVWCVLCPKCDGHTGPRQWVENRKLRSELAAAREERDGLAAKVSVLHEAVRKAVNELNEIRARDGVPYTRHGWASSVLPEYFSSVVDECWAALAATPQDALAALEARIRAEVLAGAVWRGHLRRFRDITPVPPLSAHEGSKLCTGVHTTIPVALIELKEGE